jgi:glycosyltransferase involved in cell wall biosynthesis
MKNNKIGIITRPLVKASFIPISNLLEISCSIYDQVNLITSFNGIDIPLNRKNLSYIDLNYDVNVNPILKVFKYLLMQFEIAWIMIKSRNVGTWIFFLEAHTLLLPIIISKILSDDTMILLGSSLKHAWAANNDPIIYFSTIFEDISFKLADRIIIYSPNLVKYWDLEKYNKKIIIAPRHIINFDKFKITKNFNEKENLIGYIGRLSEEKGINNFLDAIKILSKTENDLKFLIGGNGNLKVEVEKFIKKNELNDTVKFIGWIPQDKLPNYLNEIKLLVIPSYTEGLPNIMLESMACGTPVLANSVGSIPDIIEDGFNGFLIAKNSPENIAKDILRVIKSDIKEVSFNANKMVKENFNSFKVTENWKNMIKD